MSGVDQEAARGYRFALAVLAAGVVAVEACLVLPGHLLAGQIVDAALVLLLVNIGPRDRAALSERDAAALAALRALALVALIRVVSLGLPMRHWSEAVGVLAIALPLGIAALQIAPVVGIPRRRLVSPRLVLSHGFAAGAGLALGLVAYLAGAPVLWPQHAGSDAIAVAVAAAICAAAVEELIFRGVLQQTFERAAGVVGILAAGALFAAASLHAGSAPLVLTYALAGFVFAHSVQRTKLLGGAIAGHVLLAVGAGGVWPALLDRAPPLELEGTATTIALAVAVAVWVGAVVYENREVRLTERRPR